MSGSFPASQCPFCEYRMDDATAADGGVARPEPGDISMCLSCLSFLRFRQDMTLEALPDGEFRQLPDDFKNRLLHARRIMGSIDRSAL